MEQIKEGLDESQIEQQERQYGLRIRVVHAKSIQSRRALDKLSLQIHNIRQQNHQYSLISQATTFQAEKKKGIWMEDFYFNNTTNADSYQLTLVADQQDRSNSIELDGTKYFQHFKEEEVIKKTEELQFRFGNEASIVICIQVSIFQNEDFMVGVQVADLSLAGLKDKSHVPKYNAIEVYRSSKLNCFSCMDESLPGFDDLDLVCSRIKVKNKYPKQG